MTYTNGSDSPVTYYYITNLQNDVMYMVDANGTKVAEYKYDPFGKVITATGSMAAINPIRYRGYYFDTETGFYYLQARYYDPTICRFINADFPEYSNKVSLGDSNLFVYCGNNPVCNEDKNGEWLNVVIGAVVGGLIGGIVSAVTSYKETGHVDWGSVIVNTATGAISGALSATGMNMFAQAGISAVCSAGANLYDQASKNGIENVNALEVCINGAIGGVSSLIGSASGKLLGRHYDKAASTLISKGRDKFLTGYVRELAGQSHSAFYRQASRCFSQAVKPTNIVRGISSVCGSVICGGASYKFNKLKRLHWR